MLILCHLSYGPKRTSELKKSMVGVTQRMLTQQLRELENDGVYRPDRIQSSAAESGL